MIVIIGASGAVGIPLIKELTRRDTRLKVLTSNSASARNLNSLGDRLFYQIRIEERQLLKIEQLESDKALYGL